MQVVYAFTDAGLFILADPEQFALQQARFEELEDLDDLTEGRLFLVSLGGDGGFTTGLLVDEPLPPVLAPERLDEVGRGFLEVSSGAIAFGGAEFANRPPPDSMRACPPGNYEVECWFVKRDETPRRTSPQEIGGLAMAFIGLLFAFGLVASVAAWRSGGEAAWAVGAAAGLVLSALASRACFRRVPELHGASQPEFIIRLRPTTMWPDVIRRNRFGPDVGAG